MRTLLHSLKEPILSLFCFVFGAGFFNLLITVSLKERQESEQVIGYVQSAYFLGLFLGGLCVDRWIRSKGYSRCYIVFALLLAASMVAMGLFLDRAAWFFLRLLFGFSIAGMYVVIESWLLCAATKQNRGKLLSLYMIVLYLAQASSQLLYSQLVATGRNPYRVGAFFVCLSSLPIAFADSSPKEVSEKPILFLKKIGSLSKLSLATCFVSGIIQGSLYASLPSFAIGYGYDPSWILSAAILGGALFQWPVGKLSDLFGREILLLVVSFAIVLLSGTLFFLYESEQLVQILCFLLGGFSFALYPLGISHASDRLQISEMTTATALLLVVYGFGSMLSPLFSSFFLLLSPVSLFLCYLLFSLPLFVATALSLFFERKKQREKKIAEKESL